MARGPKHHLKRLVAPKHWMLDKLGGIWAPRPNPGPHKIRECLPLILMLRNRLRYAMNGREVTCILMQRLVSVDGKVRTDSKYPAGLMDVIKISRTEEHFRLIYDAKGRFNLHRVTPEEAKFKLCKVVQSRVGSRGIPYICTHDGRTIRYPHPNIQINDIVKLNLETGKIDQFVKFAVGNLCITTGGHNIGRIGIIISRESHVGAQDIIKVRDSRGAVWTTLISNVFILGEGNVSLISLSKDKGIRLSDMEDREIRIKRGINH